MHTVFARTHTHARTHTLAHTHTHAYVLNPSFLELYCRRHRLTKQDHYA